MAIKKKHFLWKIGKTSFWFGIGALLGAFFLFSFAFIFFQRLYGERIYPGVMIDGVNFGGKSKEFVANYFDTKNKTIEKYTFIFTTDQDVATISAKDLHIGYNSVLLSDQAFSIGRSVNILSNASLILQAYIAGINLSPSYTYSSDALTSSLSPIMKEITIAPIDAQFRFENGRVTTFQLSSNGQEVDIEQVKAQISNDIPNLLIFHSPKNTTIPLPIRVLKPKVSTGDANNLGITELIGTGTSLFQHSIPSRIYNVTLAASRLNGVLVADGEEFSFDKALGDVSSYTGYQQAYIISGGHTVLGDGGGVCQVSTTMFRAILNAGLPVTERHAHDYRVGYYEEDSPPGIDATVYVPTVDLKFKNDTGHAILIQTSVDPSLLRLTFYLYGTSDGRQVSMTTPIITNQTPPPPDLYQDDPTLSKGQVKQVDFSAAGASVSFSRTVTRDGKTIIADTFVSNYRPWQAVYLVGNK